jgi:dUTP pyrophosphatase
MSETIRVQFKLLEEGAKTPTKANNTDTGWDLYAYPVDVNGRALPEIVLPPRQTMNIYTGIAVCTPRGWGYSLRGRSSLNKKGIQTLYGTIDPYYTGKLFALLYNGSDLPYVIRRDDRIAQIVFERVFDVQLDEVADFVLPDGARGAKGFGSSGV